MPSPPPPHADAKRVPERSVWLPRLPRLPLLLTLTLTLTACGGSGPPASTVEEVLAILEQADADPPQREALQQAGATTFARMNCALCHTTDGSAGTGPSLQGLFDRPVTLSNNQTLTPAPGRPYAWQSIALPTSQIVKGYEGTSRMSNYGHLASPDIASLIAYLETLSERTQEPPSPTTP